MHIKKLHICGFKSFVEPTVIHFDHDVVGIVGPNGCGKSNTVDAIRWCMGEQSAKHLRGRAMEDVIFAGSETRGPHSFAEVTLTFDNSDPVTASQLPEAFREYPELAVTRRLYRDGKSEYLINRTAVRLLDVTDLFLGTGVGTKAYSIVEQGRIGQIVTARPQDRRLFIEEAAGITKYKQRKKLAERKIEQSRQNLARVSDILRELERSRVSLERQAQKAERFVRYRAELEDRVLHDASHRYLEGTVLQRFERGALGADRERLGALAAELGAHDARLEQARSEALAIETRAEAASRADFAAQNRVVALGSEAARTEDRLRELKTREGKLGAEQRENSERLERLTAEADEVAARVRSLTEQEQDRAERTQSEHDALAALRTGLGEAQGVERDVARRTSELRARIAAADARAVALDKRRKDLAGRRERLAAEAEGLAAELGALEARAATLRTSLSDLASGKKTTAEEREQHQAELRGLEPEVEKAGRALDQAKTQLGAVRGRLRALEDIQRRLVGVGAGSRALVTSGHEAVLGLVADRIEAPPELTGALAGLLGDWLQAVIVKSDLAGLELLEGLRQKKRGRASVIAATPAYVAGADAAARALASEPGCLGRLADRLHFSEDFAPLVHALVGDALVTDTPRAAVALSRRAPGVVAVSLDGTVARDNGLVCGGSGDEVAAALVEQKRELHSLGDQVAKLEAEVAAGQAHHADLRARLAAAQARVEQARQAAHRGELALVSAEKDLHRAEADLGRARQRQAAVAREQSELQRAAEDALREAETEDGGLGELRGALETALGELERATAATTARGQEVRAQEAVVTERRVLLAQAKEQLGAASAASERLAREARAAEQRLERLAAEELQTTQGLGEAAGKLWSLREQRLGAVVEARATEAELRDARGLLESVRHGLATEEARVKELRRETQVAGDSVRERELRLQRLELAEEHLVNNVSERFRGLRLARVVGDYHARPAPDDAHRARIDELSRLIERMGSVNLEAARELAEVVERATHLTTQKADIEAALTDLEKAIRQMNRESRRRFRETFDAVNLLFAKTFSTLFRGGRGELRLTDPEDLLETGVDILAMPPGKKLANIELMSGGEKALTAAALVFAIFQHRPSPFCVLDEVDAPLDEANVGRYNEIIRQMTEHSQFIVITHNRATMQAVDVLYGVTMAEPGVSRVVSTRVREDAETRSERLQPMRHTSGVAPRPSAEDAADPGADLDLDALFAEDDAAERDESATQVA